MTQPGYLHDEDPIFIANKHLDLPPLNKVYETVNLVCDYEGDPDCFITNITTPPPGHPPSNNASHENHHPVDHQYSSSFIEIENDGLDDMLTQRPVMDFSDVENWATFDSASAFPGPPAPAFCGGQPAYIDDGKEPMFDVSNLIEKVEKNIDDLLARLASDSTHLPAVSKLYQRLVDRIAPFVQPDSPMHPKTAMDSKLDVPVIEVPDHEFFSADDPEFFDRFDSNPQHHHVFEKEALICDQKSNSIIDTHTDVRHVNNWTEVKTGACNNFEVGKSDNMDDIFGVDFGFDQPYQATNYKTGGSEHKENHQYDANNHYEMDGLAQYSEHQMPAPPPPSAAAAVSAESEPVSVFDKGLLANLGNMVLEKSFHEENNQIRADYPEWRREFHFTSQIRNCLQTIFGLKSFRTNQLEVIQASLSKKDTFVLMPTGGGKSLCYQLPSVILYQFTHPRKVTFVVSPLLSLIYDQVTALQNLGIAAVHLASDAATNNGGTAAHNVPETQIIYSIKDMQYAIVYITPEKVIRSARVKNLLDTLYRQEKLGMFVIDEAHCVSNWGHDFRPDYKDLKSLKHSYPEIPTMALTATATKQVQEDILTQLQLASPVIFSQSFNRPNLYYTTEKKTMGKATQEKILKMLKTTYKNQSGIVYCFSRKEVESLNAYFRENGIRTMHYHAGLSSDDRQQIQRLWQANKFQIICATIAFGMGIDKSDVRFVIHYSMPKSLESFYQESGRAGRDGKYAECLLFYSYSDKCKMASLLEAEYKESRNYEQYKNNLKNLNKMVEYAESKDQCRKKFVINYFGQPYDPKTECLKSCDNCKSGVEYLKLDLTLHALTFIESIRSHGQQQQHQHAAGGSSNSGANRHRNGGSFYAQNHASKSGSDVSGQYTMTTLIDILRGSKSKSISDSGLDQLPFYNIFNDRTSGLMPLNMDTVKSLVHTLVTADFIVEIHATGAHKNINTYYKANMKLPRQDLENLKTAAHSQVHPSKIYLAVPSEATRTAAATTDDPRFSSKKNITPQAESKRQGFEQIKRGLEFQDFEVDPIEDTLTQDAFQPTDSAATEQQQHVLRANAESELFGMLMHKRAELAKMHVAFPVNSILNLNTLKDITRRLPFTKKEFMAIGGVNADNYKQIFEPIQKVISKNFSHLRKPARPPLQEISGQHDPPAPKRVKNVSARPPPPRPPQGHPAAKSTTVPHFEDTQPPYYPSPKPVITAKKPMGSQGIRTMIPKTVR